MRFNEPILGCLMTINVDVPRYSWNDLIANAKDGCDESLNSILEQTYNYLVLVAQRGIGKNLQAKFGASDVVQMSLVEAYEGFEAFNGTCQADLKSWLKRIVMNNLVDQSRFYTTVQRRSVTREQPLSDISQFSQSSGQDTPSAIYQRKLKDVQLLRLVSQLPYSQQRVIEYRHRYGYEYQQIANELGVSVEAARQLWSRGTRQLQAWLDKSE